MGVFGGEQAEDLARRCEPNRHPAEIAAC